MAAILRTEACSVCATYNYHTRAPQDILQPALQQAAQPGRLVSFKTIEAAIYQSYAQAPARLATCMSPLQTCLHGTTHFACWLLIAVSVTRSTWKGQFTVHNSAI